MSYFPGLFVTQYHKTKSAYFLNHDILANASPEARRKLIFYFIAEHTPQKISAEDQKEYLNDRSSRFYNSITLWTYATFLGILIPTAGTCLKLRRTTAIRDIAIWSVIAGYSATVINSSLWRTQEARMLENSEVLDRLSSKYNFGIFDFSLAMKQAHVQKLMEVYDAHRENVHDS